MWEFLRFYTAFLLKFLRRGITRISIPNSTCSSSNRTETILFRNKSPKSFLIYHHCSSYSYSSTYSSLRGGIDRIDGTLFQFYLFPKNVAFHLLFFYSAPLPIPKSYQKECNLIFVEHWTGALQVQPRFRNTWKILFSECSVRASSWIWVKSIIFPGTDVQMSNGNWILAP